MLIGVWVWKHAEVPRKTSVREPLAYWLQMTLWMYAISHIPLLAKNGLSVKIAMRSKGV